MNNNTRKYPRTVSEAFKGPEYAEWMERHKPHPTPFPWKVMVFMWLLAIFIIIVLEM